MSLIIPFTSSHKKFSFSLDRSFFHNDPFFSDNDTFCDYIDIDLVTTELPVWTDITTAMETTELQTPEVTVQPSTPDVIESTMFVPPTACVSHPFLLCDALEHCEDDSDSLDDVCWSLDCTGGQSKFNIQI